MLCGQQTLLICISSLHVSLLYLISTTLSLAFLHLQAEEERLAAEEAAKKEAEAAEGDPAVAQMRRVLSKTKSGAKVADAMKQLEVEGGLAGKWKVLYEVHAVPACNFLKPVCSPCDLHS